MKKKEMLRSCIASFLTGSIAIIAQAHGVVGLSDAPVASSVRSTSNMASSHDGRLREPDNVVTPGRVTSDESVIPRTPPPRREGREVPILQSDLQSDQVRIRRSGYEPNATRSRELPVQGGSDSTNVNRIQGIATQQFDSANTLNSANTPNSANTLNRVPDSYAHPGSGAPTVSSSPSLLGDEIERQEPSLPSLTESEARQEPPVAEMHSAEPRVIQQPTQQVSIPATEESHVSPAAITTHQVEHDLMEPKVPIMPQVGQSPIEDAEPEAPSTETLPVFEVQPYAPGAEAQRENLAFSHAEEGTEGMSIEGAVQRAIAWHPTIGEALGRLYQQGEQINVARAGYFPQISAGVSTEHRTSTGRSEDAFTISASQMLYDFGRVSSEIEAASFGVERDQARVWLAMDQLARDTAQAVIETQRFKALLDIAQEQIEGIDDIRVLAERRSALGASTRSDEIQAQSRLEAANATKLQLIAQLQTWENTLRTLIGESESISVSRHFPEYLTQSCALASENFDNSPELLVAEAQQAEARAIIAQTQASFFPTASLDAGFNQFLNNDLIEDDTDVTLRLNLTSNLYQGGATSARRRAADFSLQASQAARDSAYLSLFRSLREAKEQTASFGLRLETLDARARSIRATQELYRQQYLSLGTRSLLDLLNAEQEIHQSRFDQENTRYDLYRLQMDCLYSTANIREAFNLQDSMVQGVSISP